MTAAECMEKIEKLENFSPLPKELYIAYVKDARPHFGAMYAKLLVEDDGTIKQAGRADDVMATLWNTLSGILPIEVCEYMFWDALAMKETTKDYYEQNNEPLTKEVFYQALCEYNAESAGVFKAATDKD